MRPDANTPDKTFTIDSLKIKLDGEAVASVDKSFLAEDFAFTVSVNDDIVDYNEKDKPTIEWQSPTKTI